MKERGTLTESMFYVLMSFFRGQMCGIEITEFVERKTNGRVRLGPGIRETEIQGRKRSYQITDAGRAAFREELARLRACVDDGEEESAWTEQEK